MVVDRKTFTSNAFLLCMNFSFVISMSQLHNTLLGNYAELLFSLCGMLFFFFHFVSSAKFQWKTIIEIVALICVGVVAMFISGGATLLKLVLFFAITQDVKLKDVLNSYKWSLVIPSVIVALLSLIGMIDLYYKGAKVALGFGMQNPNTVPVIVFAIIVAFNLQNEEQLNGKVFLTETAVGLLLYYFCRARTAGIILGMYIILLVLFRNEKRLSKVVAVFQYLFLIFAVASIAIAVLFHSRTAIWYQINNVLSGRPWAWDLYFTRYGIHFWGQRIDLTIAALDNAYLRLLIQYGLLTFIAYLCLFVKISRYAYINGKVVLFFSVIAYELYFMAEFGPILVNFCPVLMYEATLLINRMQSGE